MQSTFGSNNGWRSGNSTIGDILSSFIQYGILPDDPNEKVSIRRRAPRFHYDPQTKTLYRKSYDGVLLRCLSDQDAEKVIQETHNGIFGAHQPRTSISRQNPEIGLLLALHDQGLHRLCPPVRCPPVSWWLHPPGPRTIASNRAIMVVWSLGDGRHWVPSNLPLSLTLYYLSLPAFFRCCTLLCSTSHWSSSAALASFTYCLRKEQA